MDSRGALQSAAERLSTLSLPSPKSTPNTKVHALIESNPSFALSGSSTSPSWLYGRPLLLSRHAEAAERASEREKQDKALARSLGADGGSEGGELGAWRVGGRTNPQSFFLFSSSSTYLFQPHGGCPALGCTTQALRRARLGNGNDDLDNPVWENGARGFPPGTSPVG